MINKINIVFFMMVSVKDNNKKREKNKDKSEKKN